MNVALWLFDHGVRVFPIKARSKEPACRWTEYLGRREHVAEFGNYGVRLGFGDAPLAVLDPDQGVLCRAIERGEFEVPVTPFVVETTRGLHFYYRLPRTEDVPKFVRRFGVSIEFRNKGQYVVGAGSTHPSGKRYAARDWSWCFEDIPIFPVDTYCFDDGTFKGAATHTNAGEAFELPSEVREPERHETLNSLIASIVCNQNQQQLSQKDLWDLVCEMAQGYAENICVPPLDWNRNLESFVARSFKGALRLRERTKPTESHPLGGDAPWPT